MDPPIIRWPLPALPPNPIEWLSLSFLQRQQKLGCSSLSPDHCPIRVRRASSVRPNQLRWFRRIDTERQKDRATRRERERVCVSRINTFEEKLVTGCRNSWGDCRFVAPRDLAQVTVVVEAALATKENACFCNRIALLLFFSCARGLVPWLLLLVDTHTIY